MDPLDFLEIGIGIFVAGAGICLIAYAYVVIRSLGMMKEMMEDAP